MALPNLSYMTEYLLKAASVWFAGFFPFFEIYAAIPYGFVIGLDATSIVIWAVFGNFLPVPLIEYGYGYLQRWERFRHWQNKWVSPKLEKQINNKGSWFIPVLTPWIGVWAVALTCKLLKVDGRLLMLYTFVGIAVYAIVLASLISLGMAGFSA